MKDTQVKNRARLEILNYIICFSTLRNYGSGIYNTSFGVEKAFVGGLGEMPPIGSLCRLSAAPFSKYYLAWLIDYKEEGYGGNYLLESIEDGSLCWWSNVGIDYYHPTTVASFPQWRWTDKQFEFNDRWHRTCKRMDAYIVLPSNVSFGDDYKATLSTRIRYGLSNERSEKTFEDWRKVKVSDMKEFYKQAVKQHDERPKGELPSIHDVHK